MNSLEQSLFLFVLCCCWKQFFYLLGMPCPQDVLCTTPAWIHMSNTGFISIQAVELPFNVANATVSIKTYSCKKIKKILFHRSIKNSTLIIVHPEKTNTTFYGSYGYLKPNVHQRNLTTSKEQFAQG